MSIKPCTVLDSGLPSVEPSVLGFPVTPNQYNILSEDEVVNSEPGQDQSLEDPRRTRAQRQPASSSIGEQGITMGEGVAENFVPPNSENDPLFFNSLSVSPVELLNAESAGNW